MSRKRKVFMVFWFILLFAVFGWCGFIFGSWFFGEEAEPAVSYNPMNLRSWPQRLPATLGVDYPPRGYTGPCHLADERGGESVCLDWGSWHSVAERIDFPDSLRGTIVPRGTEVHYKHIQLMLCIPGEPPRTAAAVQSERDPQYRCTHIYTDEQGYPELVWSIEEAS